MLTSVEDQLRPQKDIASLKYYMKDLLTFMTYLQVWPVNNTIAAYKILPVTGMVIILLTANFLLVISEILLNFVNFNIQQFASSIGALGLHSTACLKWMFCVKKSNEIVLLISKLDKCHILCSRIKDTEEAIRGYIKQIEQASSQLNLFTYVWTWCCIYGTLHWCLAPLFVKLFIKYAKADDLNFTAQDENTLPYLAWYPWSITTFYGYWFTYILQTLGGLGSGFGVVSYDALYISILIIVCAQFQYLSESLCDDNHANTRKHQMRHSLNTKLKNCVAHHSEILQFINDLEMLVNPIMFMQCIETLAVICLLSFQASTINFTFNVECLMMIWKLMEYFMAVGFQLYVFCFYATQVKYLVADVVYSCGWESVINNENNEKSHVQQWKSIRDTKSLVEIIMIRAQKPVILTGGPFYELSLETFKAIMGMAVSNSVMLRQLSESA